MQTLKRGEPKKRVTIRLEPSLVQALRQEALRRGTAYQTLVRQVLWAVVRDRK